MNKGTIVLIILWSLLALTSFVSSFWISVLWLKVANFVFGVTNCGLIMSFASVLRAEKKNKEDNV